MALSRTGYDPHEYFSREDFEHIFDFNTNAVISVLGSATSDISEMVIKEIGETVKELEKEEIEKALIYECERFYKVFKKIQKRG